MNKDLHVLRDVDIVRDPMVTEVVRLQEVRAQRHKKLRREETGKEAEGRHCRLLGTYGFYDWIHETLVWQIVSVTPQSLRF